MFDNLISLAPRVIFHHMEFQIFNIIVVIQKFYVLLHQRQLDEYNFIQVELINFQIHHIFHFFLYLHTRI